MRNIMMDILINAEISRPMTQCTRTHTLTEDNAITINSRNVQVGTSIKQVIRGTITDFAYNYMHL